MRLRVDITRLACSSMMFVVALCLGCANQELHGHQETVASIAAMTRTIAERAAELGLESVPEGKRAGHYLGLKHPEGLPDDLLPKLAERNVFVSV